MCFREITLQCGSSIGGNKIRYKKTNYKVVTVILRRADRTEDSGGFESVQKVRGTRLGDAQDGEGWGHSGTTPGLLG